MTVVVTPFGADELSAPEGLTVVRRPDTGGLEHGGDARDVRVEVAQDRRQRQRNDRRVREREKCGTGQRQANGSSRHAGDCGGCSRAGRTVIRTRAGR